MIFVCVGSRDYQFNRLLKELDELVAEGKVSDEIVAQTGLSEYEPKNYTWHRYLDQDVFKDYQQKADLIISHGGTGALVGALKMGKQVIAVPRLAQYGEHIDDHQTQVCGALAGEGYLRQVLDMKDLGAVIEQCKREPIIKKYDKPSNVLPMIEAQLEKWFG